LSIAAKVRFPDQAEDGWTVAAQLFDTDGATVFQQPLQALLETKVRGYFQPRLQADLTGEVIAPKLWSSEAPNLYAKDLCLLT